MLKNLLRLQRCSSVLVTKVPLSVTGSLQQRTFAGTEGNWVQEVVNEHNRTKAKRISANPFADEPKAQTESLQEEKTKVDAKRIETNAHCDEPKLQEEHLEKKETQLDAENEQRRKVLMLEADIARQEGHRVPSLDFIKDNNWQYILTLPTKSARFKYYSYLWQIEVKKASKERKKAERAEGMIERKEELRRQREENTHIIYGLGHCSLFLRIYDSTINHWQNNRLTRAMQFAPKLVIDCSYDDFMNNRESVNAAKQLMLSFADNRAHDDPYDLHYCNVNFDSTCIKNLKKFIPTMLDPEFPMNIHQKCFTELFPRENLVYLTPHCRTDLLKYNPDDVYIIGGMVDTVNNEPLSLAKAKKLGIRMARLPLDQHLQWGSGSGKSLTINQMISIMLDLRRTGDWGKALLHVPRRKIVDLSGAQSMRKRNSATFNIRHILDDDEVSMPRQQVRSYKKELQFDLNTWPSMEKKKERT